ncbi:MAG: response regulator [bacterium]
MFIRVQNNKVKTETNKKKIKILLIDDDETMSIYFRDVFWIHGKGDIYNVATVPSIEEAEKIIENKNERPDTIFLDILMSSKGKKLGDKAYQMSHSLDFINKIKKNKDLADINIIIYSGQREKYLKQILEGIDVDGYLIKGETMPREIVAFADKIHGTNN